MSLNEEAAASLAAAADSVHPDLLQQVVSELGEAHRFVAAAGSMYESDWGSVIGAIAAELNRFTESLTRLQTHLNEEASRLRAGS